MSSDPIPGPRAVPPPAILLEPVRHFLTGHKMPFREGNGVLSVGVPLPGDGNELVVARFRAGGGNRGITARVTSPRVISKAEVPRAALAANQWNAGHLAPRAVLVPRTESEGSGLLLDAWLPASPRIEQPQVDLFIVAVLRGARAFWGAVTLGSIPGEGPPPQPETDAEPFG